jgi:NAD(P)-dependent dehydrogenase (short-subunit alcohol dehydrogenase family)
VDYQVEPQALKGHVILVTGAGAGIGKQAAVSYAEHGATVILLGKTVNKLEATFDEIVAAGFPEPAIVPLDLKGASKQNYLDMVDTIEQEYGRLDGILHNASLLGMIGPFEHIEEDSFDDLMQVNVKAELLMTQAALPLLRKSPQGRVVFTSSTVGHSGRALWGAYAISKFATEGMMQVLADEMSNTNVRINAINPGATRTNMRAQAYPAEDANMLKTPLELMPLYLYLMSAESQDINGQCIDAQPKR